MHNLLESPFNVFSVFKKTVFFRKGGGLLFVAIILVSLPITVLLFPTIQSSTNNAIFKITDSCTCNSGWIWKENPSPDGTYYNGNGTASCGETFWSSTGDNTRWTCCSAGGKGNWAQGEANQCPQLPYSLAVTLNQAQYKVGDLLKICYTMTPSNIPYIATVNWSELGQPYYTLETKNVTGGSCYSSTIFDTLPGTRSVFVEATVNNIVVAQGTTNVTITGGTGTNPGGNTKTHCDAGGIVVSGVANYSYTQATCDGTTVYLGTDDQYYKCGTNCQWQSQGAWQAACGAYKRDRPAGQKDCAGADIIDNLTGTNICGGATFVGNAGFQVCGSNKTNYICDGNTGQWIPDTSRPGTCGPGGTQSCTNNGTTSVLCGTQCRCIGQGDASCDKSTVISLQISECNPGGASGGKWTCPNGTPICQFGNTPTPKPGNTGTVAPTGGGGGGGATTTPNKTPTPIASTVAPTTTTGPGTPTSTPRPPTGTNIPNQPTATNGPTPTTAPNASNLALEVWLAGIGANTAQGLNSNPVRTSQPVQVEIFNTQGNKVKSVSGTLSFDQGSKSFKGTIPLGTDVPNGIYVVKGRLDNTLWKKATAQITQGQTTTIPAQRYVTGDLNQDNQLNLTDYTLMISCYGTKQCSQKTLADLNIDGKVDELDLNILYSEFGTRQGD